MNQNHRFWIFRPNNINSFHSWPLPMPSILWPHTLRRPIIGLMRTLAKGTWVSCPRYVFNLIHWRALFSFIFACWIMSRGNYTLGFLGSPYVSKDNRNFSDRKWSRYEDNMSFFFKFQKCCSNLLIKGLSGGHLLIRGTWAVTSCPVELFRRECGSVINSGQSSDHAASVTCVASGFESD